MSPPYKFLKNAKKFVVRKYTQLTSLQPYVSCRVKRTADIIKEHFEVASRNVSQYGWLEGACCKEDHWCVTPDIPWALANARDVRVGQWYIGVWSDRNQATALWEDLLTGSDTVDDYAGGVGPVLESGYVVVNTYQHANPDVLWCYRYQIQSGEAFEYFDEPGQPYVAVTHLQDETQAPSTWLVSSTRTAQEKGKLTAKVLRIPRWDAKGVGLAVLPQVDPLERLGTVDGLDARTCLRRYEEALQTEDIGTLNGRRYVPVPAGLIGAVGGVTGGLTPDQVDFAKQAWSAQIRIKHEEQRKRDAERAKRDVLPCDDVDELPNMAYVDENG